MEEQSRSLQETMDALLSETRQSREAKDASTGSNRGLPGGLGNNLNNSSVEMHLVGIHETVKTIKQELEEVKKELRETNRKVNASSSLPNTSNESHPRRPLEMSDLQEALTQQAAVIQMGQYGMLGPLLAANAAVRQPVPAMPSASVLTHPQQMNPLLHMQGGNPHIGSLDQSRLPGALGSTPLNPWPASTPAPQQPLPQVGANISAANNPNFNLPQTPVSVPRSIVAATVTEGNHPTISFNPRQDVCTPSTNMNGFVTSQPTSTLSPANVVITTSDRIPTEEDIKAAAATSNTPIINSVTVPPQHRLGGITTPSNLTTPTRNAHLAALEAVSPATPETVYATPPTQLSTGRTQNPSGGGGTPHDYHISLPSGVSPLTTSPFAEHDGPAVPITTTSIWSHIPAPSFSSLSNLNGGGGVVGSNKTPEKPNNGFSGFFTGSGGRQRQASVSSVKSNGSYVENDEHDPHFEAIIPLPDIVETKTGEEEEEILFEDRCKLYRWATGMSGSKEWKERGIGQIKILQSKKDEKKVRILMRREQILKLCANHYITSDMSIDFMKNSGNKAATWIAPQDFSDDEPQTESFSARFKTPEQAEAFIQSFKEAQTKTTPSNTKEDSPQKEATPVVSSPAASGVEIIKADLPTAGFGDLFKAKAGSWECPGCCLRHPSDLIECPCCETAQPGREEEVKAKKEAEKAKEEASKPKFNFLAPGGGFQMPGAGASSNASTGFTFGQNVAASTPAQGGFVFGQPATEKKEEEAKPSPFAGFSFAGSSSTNSTFGSGVQTLTTTTSQEQGDSEELTFDGQGLKLNTGADAQIVADKIKSFANGKMKILTLSGNTIGIDAANEIGKALESRSELERAHWKDMFTGRMKTEIPPALKHMGNGVMKAGANLVELDVSDNAFGPIGVEGIVDLLKSPACRTLKELKLNNTGCGVTGGKLLAKTLLEAYHESVKVDASHPFGLRVFILGRSRQENEGGKALAEVFKLMGTLEEVVMPQNGIYHVGIEALADAWGNNPNLRILNINDNTLTEKGAKHLAVALKKLKHLEVLNIGDCLLKTSGALLIADALKESGAEKLQELYMDSNEIRIEGGLAIVEAVKSSPNLKLLMLDGNQFGDDGCSKIEQILKDSGKSHIMEEFEDDQGSDEDSEEDDDDSNEDGDDDYEDEEDEDGGDEDDEGKSVENVSSGLFGSKQGTPSLFGSATTGNTSSTSIFGETKACSIFGTPSQENKSISSIFGGNKSLGANNENSTSIFGTPKNNESSPSIFGSDKKPTSSIFGGATSGPTSIFGQAVANSATGANSSIFGKSTPGPETNVFGSAPSTGTSIFGQAVASSVSGAAGSIFGGNASSNVEDKENKGIDLSANKQLSSFAAISAGDKPLFGQKTEGFSFAGAGQSVFGGANKLTNGAKEDENDDSHVEENEHDPHFEPIIPLPELIDVKTGEEEEEETFKHRAKVYRYDTETKQWKERGVGDIKILKHPQKNTYRVLLRRDQTHKVACNHMINEVMELKPMSSSETALCWYAVDYADGDGKTEQLAVKFKLAETKNDFKSAFESAQEALRNKKDTPTKEPAKAESPEKEKDAEIPKVQPKEEKTGVDLSANKNLFSFASISTSDKPLFGQKTEGFSFAGANKPLFGNTPKVTNDANTDEPEGDQVEENEHDPHFEPIIPLPELVDVKTGEEEEEEVFKHRAKVYRYDTETKQWKERGVGDMKILKHPKRGTFRVLLRRDQTLKVACNHMINTVMELKPMATSETALCWHAIDFADGEGKTEQLAVKFKLAETKNDFKSAFESAQDELKNKPANDTSDDTNKLPSAQGESPEKQNEDAQREDEDYEDEEVRKPL